MKEKIEIIKLKIFIILMNVLILVLIGNWIQNLLCEGEVAEKFWASREEILENKQSIEVPSPTPFTLSNFDRIRVVLTNKETGGIYHKDKEYWEKCDTYRGTLEIIEEEDGYVIINELPIEEYLYSVVPSEMPASYPLEALKAQAICARTYAYLHILSPGFPQWNAHVDDTTAYQVYHSIQEQSETTRTVNETEKMVLVAPEGNSLAQTYYYSTSCGYGSDAHVWRTRYSDCYPYIKSRHINSEDTEQKTLMEDEFENYIKTVDKNDYESQEGWYRWTYEVENVDYERIEKILQRRYEANPKLVLTCKKGDYISQPIGEIGKVRDIQIGKREAGNVVDELLIVTDAATYKVITELNIRYVLNDGCSLVKRQDGVSVEMNSLLPSAFFVLELIREDEYISGYKITGGGFGHGAGMSQNAAKAMAEQGMRAEEILAFFYEGCIIKDR